MRVRPLYRKLKYVRKTAEPDAVVTTSWRFGEIADVKNLMIGLSVLFRSIADIILQFSFHFDFTQFEWNPVDFTLFTTEEFQENYERTGKGYYDISLYDISYYDPPDVNIRNMERIMWELRYKTTDLKELKYRLAGETLRRIMNAYREMLKQKKVADWVIDAIELALSETEGKVLNCAYWGFAVWEGSPWSEEDKIKFRSVNDWLTEIIGETINLYDAHWDIDRWDYCRWMDNQPYPERQEVETIWTEEAEEYIDSTIEEFMLKTSPVWQGVFLLQRSDRMHMHGGYHQIKMQNVNALVKRICHRHGVPSTQVYSYIAFAHELLYLRYKGYRKYKQWREMTTPDDIIRRYASMGLDKHILGEIRSALGL